jgi:lipid II:glycine glycyltransferase (peptidoglycan interpeptide bridge formation enzyme)
LALRETGETVFIDLRLSEAEIWQETRPEHRNKINRCKRAGFTARMVQVEQYISEFITIYEETMERVGAAQSYYFNKDYYLELRDALGEQLHLCIVELNNQVACAGLFTECCGIVQYHLGGTRNHFLKQAPSKLMFDYVRFWAKDRGNEVFHLGGGVGSAKDSLYHFKAGFSKQRDNFMTLRLITDEIKYRELVELRAKSLNTDATILLATSFFPAYRSSLTS